MNPLMIVLWVLGGAVGYTLIAGAVGTAFYRWTEHSVKVCLKAGAAWPVYAPCALLIDFVALCMRKMGGK